MRKLQFAIGFSVVALSAGSARADDKAAAQAAFDLGRQLMVEGRFAEACPKLEESQRLQSGVGTMLYLAACYEKVGRTASAWAQFREAESLAGRVQDQRAGVARERANALEPKLARLTIVVPASLRSLDKLEVKRDSIVVGAGVFDAPIPVDPGPHRITVGASGKKPWASEVRVAPEDVRASIRLPESLEDAPPEAAAAASNGIAPPDEKSSDAGNTQRIVGLVVGGVGIVGLGVGGIFGLQAKSKLDDSNADDKCRGNVCNPTGYEARESARDAALVSTVTFIVGAAALAGGAVIFLTAPKPARKAAAFAPWFVPGAQGTAGGVSWSRSF